MLRSTHWMLFFALMLALIAGLDRIPSLYAAPPDPVAQPAALTHRVFVALARNAGAPQSAPSGVANGGFESGTSAWAISSTFGGAVVRQTFVGQVRPHTGSFAAWLGGRMREKTTLQQQITVSAATPYLAYWHWIASSDFCGYDRATVRVNQLAVNTYDLCDETSTGGWAKHVVNLSAYAGQSVKLEIGVSTDSTFNSNLFLDDVGFQSAPTALELAALAPASVEQAPAVAEKPATPPSDTAQPEAGLIEPEQPQPTDTPAATPEPTAVPTEMPTSTVAPTDAPASTPEATVAPTSTAEPTATPTVSST